MDNDINFKLIHSLPIAKHHIIGFMIGLLKCEIMESLKDKDDTALLNLYNCLNDSNKSYVLEEVEAIEAILRGDSNV